MEERLEELNNSKIVIVLKLVNTRFKAILALKKVIVNVYNDNPSCFIRAEMENCKWIIIEIKYEEEWEVKQVNDNEL
jgi:hypothetical protein